MVALCWGYSELEYVVQELQRRGVVDPARIAVGGHSYGAFMAANLLAHAPELFACGIARSGAYNRYLCLLCASLNLQALRISMPHQSLQKASQNTA